MPTIRIFTALFVSLLCSALFATPPGPYVALRIDYHKRDPVPAGRTDSATDSKVGEQRGSGVVIGSTGMGSWYVLTNWHVVEAGPEVGRTVPHVFAGGQWRSGRVVATDADADLALVRIRFAQELYAAKVAGAAPKNKAEVSTHGYAGGTKYCRRTTELRYALPLADGAMAWAPQRYYVRTVFHPGESGGAVVSNGRLVGLIHGNDAGAGWGLVVDHPAIVSFLTEHTSASMVEPEDS